MTAFVVAKIRVPARELTSETRKIPVWAFRDRAHV